ncbi:translation initiation factor IF-2-like [Camelus ferus]|uniref:Translation initiation factor IF-2-like n=1 Tax=Camelus ferus TaxID=419612 RepID=A0A8B8RWA4_CAMFR|nr:translation initiation factor IF-2-like [Camelus ferus]
MAEKDPELPSSREHTEVTTICTTTIDEKGWNLPGKVFSNIKKEPQRDGKRGGLRTYSIPILEGGRPTNRRIIITQRLSHRSRSSAAPGAQHGKDEPPGHLASKGPGPGLPAGLGEAPGAAGWRSSCGHPAPGPCGRHAGSSAWTPGPTQPPAGGPSGQTADRAGPSPTRQRTGCLKAEVPAAASRQGPAHAGPRPSPPAHPRQLAGAGPSPGKPAGVSRPASPTQRQMRSKENSNPAAQARASPRPAGPWPSPPAGQRNLRGTPDTTPNCVRNPTPPPSSPKIWN